MRINFTDEKMEYIGCLADALDISIPDLIMKALHIVDTIQLCDAQDIKAVFLEDDEPMDFKDLFEVFPIANNAPAEGETALPCPTPIPSPPSSDGPPGITTGPVDDF